MYVEGVETRDIHIFVLNFLNIQPIFNPKKNWKAETFQPYHQILCMLKHVEGVEREYIALQLLL